MKLGMNTFFINMFDFEEGLQFCQEQGVQAVEVAAGGPGAVKYCDVDRLLADQGELIDPCGRPARRRRRR